jgi:lipopolysaccharide export system permease protein
MRTLRRYLASEITVATALVMTALLMLLAFFDLVHEVNDLGVGGYKLKDVVLHVLLSLPNHVYEAFPIAVLIGTLFAMAQLAASSEYVVIRSSGVSLIRLNLSLARSNSPIGCAPMPSQGSLHRNSVPDSGSRKAATSSTSLESLRMDN